MGQVYDRKTGRTLAGAEISATNLALSETRTVSSNSSGFYALPLLSPGTYSLQTSLTGYQSAETYEIELTVAGRTTLDFPLRRITDVYGQDAYQAAFVPGGTSIVHIYAADIQTTRAEPLQVLSGQADGLNSSISYVVDPRQIEHLPLFGRDVYTLLILYPGVTADTATARGLGISVNGQRPSASNFLLDGLENNNYLVSGPLTTVAPEAIQEYRISTNNFTAEYGRTSGFLANAVTRGGGSAWHGLAYFYWKNEALNANDFQRNFAGLPRVPIREIEPGFSAGGPVLPDRLFASAAFDHVRFRSRTEPVQFNLLPGTFVPQVGSSAERLLQTFRPIETTSSGGSFAPPSSLDRSLGFSRIDYFPRNSSHRLYGRVAVATLKRPDLVWTPYPDFITPLTQNTFGFGASWITTVRPNFTNDLRIGRTSDDLRVDRPHPEVPLLESLDGFDLPGSPAPYSYRNRTHNWELIENVLWLKGRHMLKAGGGLLIRNLDGYLTVGRDGYYLFQNITAFGADRPFEGWVAIPRLSNGRPDYDRRYRHNQYFLFAQDTFRVTPRLVLDYGLRYESFGVPRNTGSRKDLLVEFGLGDSIEGRISSAFLNPAGSGSQALYAADRNDVSVRFGFAYGIGSQMRHRLRGNYGTFYDRLFDNLWQTVRNNDVVIRNFTNPLDSVDLLNPVFNSYPLFVDTGGSNLSRLTVIQPRLRTPYVQSFFLGTQHDLTRNLTVEISGMGSLGRKLITTDIVNRPASIGEFRIGNAARRFNPGLPELYYRANQGSSNYRALAATVRHRSNSVHFQAAYTLSLSRDNQSDPLRNEFLDLNFLRPSASTLETTSNFPLQFDSSSDIGSSDFDQRHNLLFVSIWSMPPIRHSRSAPLLRNWQIAQLAAFRSGFPYSVLANVPSNPSSGGLIFNNRANVIDPASVFIDQSEPGGRRVLNAGAFELPAVARLGNSPRNAFAGPGLYSLDLSISRTFSVRQFGENGRLTIRADAFNVLNHANLGNPYSLLNNQQQFGVAQFGRKGKTTGFPGQTPLNETARQIQLLLRIYF